MKRFFAFFLTVLWLLGILTGCSPSNTDHVDSGNPANTDFSADTKENSIESLFPSVDPSLPKIVPVPTENPLVVCTEEECKHRIEALIKGWSLLYPGFHAKLITLPMDPVKREAAVSSVITDILAGGGPDVFLLPTPSPDSGYTVFLFENPEKNMLSGHFLPLDEYLKRASYLKADQLNLKIMSAGRTKEGQVLLPVSYNYYLYGIDSSLLSSAPLTQKELFCTDIPLLKQAISSSISVNGHYCLQDIADVEGEDISFSDDVLIENLTAFFSAEAAAGQLPEELLHGEVSFLATDKLPKNPTTWFPLWNEKDGITATISFYGAVNRNTKQAEVAFSLLDLLFAPEILSNDYISYKDKMIGGFIVPTIGISVLKNAEALKSKNQNFYTACIGFEEKINGVRLPSLLDREVSDFVFSCLSDSRNNKNVDAFALSDKMEGLKDRLLMILAE